MESGGENLQANSGGDGDIFCDIGSPVFHFNHPVPFRQRHLTCLKLGKRQYYEESRTSDPLKGMKRERSSRSSPSSSPAPATAPPRCQVEGCNVELVDAKDYHRRHKVCQIHAKAPNVIVLGVEQRFCQQCSRFHVISEFDESKRSCRRRLAGHNERRRKNSGESFIRPIDGAAAGGRALPLLSSASSSASVWAGTDFSSQSSAALRELIAENRAAVLAGQLLSGGLGYPLAAYHPPPPPAAPPQVGEDVWDNLRGAADSHVTLDLMQTARSKSRDEDEECCDLWRSLEETHVV